MFGALWFFVTGTNIYINGDKKFEVFSLTYSKETKPFLYINMSYGDRQLGDTTPVLTSNSDFDTKQIEGTEVKLRKTQNVNLPAAQFTIKNGLQFTIDMSDLSESEVEKVVISILQAYTKL